MIPFNKPYITGKEVDYIYDAVSTGHISGNGKYTRMCQKFFEERYKVKRCLLTTSCTDALEMCAMLINTCSEDEIIVPSYTFVSSALPFIRQGAKIIFAESRNDSPGIDETKIESLITKKTKAIVVVHYAGIACKMDVILELANKYGLYVIEDAAQSIESFYHDKLGNKKPLGTLGHLSAFSFHETKNIQCGEGGLLLINDERFINRAEVLWEKGTNRAEFFRGEINKYSWVDIGSSFLPSEITAAFLWSQLEELDNIQQKRVLLWENYMNELEVWARLKGIVLPYLPQYATQNGHIFYLVMKSLQERSDFIAHLKKKKIHSVFHYLSLHESPFFKGEYTGNDLIMANYYSDCLVRLPLYCGLSNDDQNLIIQEITSF